MVRRRRCLRRVLQKASNHALLSDIVAKQRRRLHRFWTSEPGRLERLALCAEETPRSLARLQTRIMKATCRLVHDHIDHMEASLIRQFDVARPFISTNSSALDHV